MLKSNQYNLILAIDTSCDDTSVSITYKNYILSNVVSSQIKAHKIWGGTVPMLAKREHEKRINNVVKYAIKRAKINLNTTIKRFNLASNELLELQEKIKKGKYVEFVDAIAVTYGPGLSIALEVGVKKAQELAIKYNKPLFAINHMHGHFFSSFVFPLSRFNSIINVDNLDSFYPILGLLFSGGHSEFILSNKIGNFKILGATLDDALGEAFDKVARMLNLGYPGGPVIEQLAQKGKININFPIPMQNSNDYNLSFSGLKTAMLYKIRDLKGENRVQPKEKKISYRENIKLSKVHRNTQKLQKQIVYDLCASFQNSAFKSVIFKLNKILKNNNKIKSIVVGGGVFSNVKFRYEVKNALGVLNPNIKIFIPYSTRLFTDNAGMIGISAYILNYFNKLEPIQLEKDILKLDRNPSLTTEEFYKL